MILGAIPQRCLSRPAEIVRCCLNLKSTVGKTMREKFRDKQADKPMGESTSAGLSAFLRQVGRAGRMKCGTEVGDGTSV